MHTRLPGDMWLHRFAHSLHRKLGITRLRYLSMLDAQGRRCAICGVVANLERLFAFCVDHDHRTGKVRALLCRDCNVLIGIAKEDPSVLTNAAAYLTRHKR
ncbi:MAG TPA: endonuclease VII domain-containing protein [Polyangiaceae bacterium]